MHRIATQPGGWDPTAEGVVFIDQDPAPLILLTAADTDIQALAAARSYLPADFPAVRVTNLLNLQQHLSIDTYADTVLAQAQGILVRLLGGKAYWTYGLEVLKHLATAQGIHLVVIPGDDRPDWDLISHSTLSLDTVNQLWQYFLEGGPRNLSQALCLLANQVLERQDPVLPPHTLPTIGLYTPTPSPPVDLTWPRVGILVYRAHIVSGNTAPIDALWHALIERRLQPQCLYVYGLQDPECPPAILEHLQGIDVLLNTTSFSLAKLHHDTPNVTLWQTLNVPVLQVILSGGSREAWQSSTQGLAPRDLAMNIALPEVDGRLITRAISFKGVAHQDPDIQTDIVTYHPEPNRITFVAELAARWSQLRRTPPVNRKIALILANYPNRDGRLANGVGLDTPASCVKVLEALHSHGYHLGSYIPTSSSELMDHLTQGITNDPMSQMRAVQQKLDPETYQALFTALPPSIQAAVRDRWGDPPTHPIPIAGLQLGHIFIGIQPSRGYDIDPSLSYHAPDLVPPHAYLAFYGWIRHHWQAHAIVHLGKHGNLEWLPGKATALSAECYPDICLGPLPHLYPFIVNDPGEGSQAKRRAQAVIIDHLTPPLTRAELYGPLLALEKLVDEYTEAQTLDPPRLEWIRPQIHALLTQTHLSHDLRLAPSDPSETPDPLNNSDPFVDPDRWLNRLDGYLCELKEAQIRDGLHILGTTPTGPQLVSLLQALARYPGGPQLGLTQAIAQDWGIEMDPLTTPLTTPWPPVQHSNEDNSDE